MKYITFILGLLILILAGLFFPRVNQTPRLKTGIVLVESPRMDMASVPRVFIEATVESVEPDPNIACNAVCPQTEYPKDYATLRITKVITTQNTDMTSLADLEVGKQVRVRAGYSVRPAIIRYIPETEISTGNPDAPVSHIPNDAKPLEKESGAFVYTLHSAKSTIPGESRLPGLKPDDRIVTTIDIMALQDYLMSDYQLLQSN